MIKPFKLLIIYSTVLFFSGCNTTPLKYTLDPEFSYLEDLGQGVEMVAVKVTDNRQRFDGGNGIQGPSDVAGKLKNRLVEKLQQHGYKIINKPLLADIAYELEINELSLVVNKSMLKSLISGKSNITFTVRKHSEFKTKIFSATKTQEVANPTNDLDVTGVVNQMLSSLFANMFSDPQITKFTRKSQ